MRTKPKRAFVPTSLGPVDRLEERVVMSGIPMMRGVALLTNRTLSKSVSQIQKAFNRFGSHGLNYNQLRGDLNRAIANIPFHRVDGLNDSMNGIVGQLQSDIQGGVSRAVMTAYQDAIAALRDQVQARVADGSVVRR